MVENIGHLQKEFAGTKENAVKKKLGQYFTDPSIAKYMSTLISTEHLTDKEEIHFLDCGAGHGILTVSTALYLLSKGVKKLNAVLYEIDLAALDGLKKNMEFVKSIFQNEEKKFDYFIKHEDFILERPDLNSNGKFDISVINPPYFKYSSEKSPYSRATKDLFKGDPNIYSSFIAVMVSCLANGGQGVVISPRSFLNGLYFKGFRKFLLEASDLKQVHIFNSRKNVFLDSEVLQENIIFKIEKTTEKTDSITISSSAGAADLAKSSQSIYSKEIIIDKSNDESIIRIPENSKQYEILLRAEALPSVFEDEEYFISTGRVVEHRQKDYLRRKFVKAQNVPLLKAHNVSIKGVQWDGNHKKDLRFRLTDSFEKYLIPNKRLVILKRFTAKDEKKRLVAAVYHPSKIYPWIGITNKLNYLGKVSGEMGELEAIGLSALLNSTFMDEYYRCISGNTQVNATDIRILKFPTSETIIEIGREFKEHNNQNTKTIDSIVNKYLYGFKGSKVEGSQSNFEVPSTT